MENRLSDTVNQIGIAIVQEDIFMGWISRKDQGRVMDFMRGNPIVYAQIVTYERYYWEQGGGWCTRGIAKITGSILESGSSGNEEQV